MFSRYPWKRFEINNNNNDNNNNKNNNNNSDNNNDLNAIHPLRGFSPTSLTSASLKLQIFYLKIQIGTIFPIKQLIKEENVVNNCMKKKMDTINNFIAQQFQSF